MRNYDHIIKILQNVSHSWPQKITENLQKVCCDASIGWCCIHNDDANMLMVSGIMYTITEQGTKKQTAGIKEEK